MKYSNPRTTSPKNFASIDNIDKKCEYLCGMALYGDEPEFVKLECYKLIRHDNPNLREVAVISLGHLAINKSVNWSPKDIDLLKDLKKIHQDLEGVINDTLGDIQIMNNSK